MDLSKYIFPLRKWWWLLVASTLVAAISSSLAALRQPTIYQARTTLMIGRIINDPNPSSNEFLLSQQLAAAYADIANRELVRNATMESLGLNRLPDYLARALPNTQLIEIAVTDVSPERAQAVANELAVQLILLSPTSAPPEEQGRQEFVNRQLNSLEIQIEETQKEIERLQAELGNMVSARQISDTQGQITALQSKLSTLQGNYANLLSNTQQGAINTLNIIEPAGLPSRPIGPKRGLTVLLASVAGLALAAGAAYLLEFLDDTLKTPDEIMSLFKAPVIGYIFEDRQNGTEKQVYVAENPRHPITEAYRALRTNLELVEIEQPPKTIFVASPGVGDGKTSVAANLAAAIAQGEKRVILLDADLRRPSIHEYFNLSNEQGLIDLFVGRKSIGEVLKIKKGEKIAILTAGKPPSNPAELLGSKKMDLILDKLGQVADFIIIDGPPFIIADASILASKADAVLAVVRPGHTPVSTAQAMMEQLKIAGTKLIGVTLNRIPTRNASYYSGKHYLYPYYLENSGNARKVNFSNINKWLQVTLLIVSRLARTFKIAYRTIFKPNPK